MNKLESTIPFDGFYESFISADIHHQIQFDTEYYSERNLSYFSYLSSFINFEKVNNIFDYGAGNGNLGYLIKKKFKHIKLYSIELGVPSREILQKRKYKLFDSKEITKNLEKIYLKLSN